MTQSDELTKLRSNVQIGVIPDATTIHLAKKQREMARRQQEQELEANEPLPSFIPLNKRTTKSEDVLVHKTHNSRLVREEMDVDLSEDDEPLILNKSSRTNRNVAFPYNREISSDEDEEVILRYCIM